MIATAIGMAQDIIMGTTIMITLLTILGATAIIMVDLITIVEVITGAAVMAIVINR